MASALNRITRPSITSTGLWKDVVEALRRVTVEVIGPTGNRGAGVVLSGDGLVVTNAHVVNRTTMIRLHDGRTCRAEMLRADDKADLALLGIPARGIESARLRDSSTLRAGELLVAVGHPMGATGAMSLGIVHATCRGRLVEADIRLAPGNSGGPLADVAGHVVGINRMVVNGMGVAVSTTTIQQFLLESMATVRGAG
jgi:serine protease Do